MANTLKPFTPDPDAPHLCSQDCWVSGKPSLVVVSSDGEHGYVHEWVGGAIDYVMSEYPNPHEAFDGMDAGVWIAHMHVDNSRDYWGEYDEEIIVDDLRKLTAEEWELLQTADQVLDDAGYLKCQVGKTV